SDSEQRADYVEPPPGVSSKPGTTVFSPHCSEAKKNSPTRESLRIACQQDFCGAIDASALHILRRNSLEHCDTPGGNAVARSTAGAYADRRTAGIPAPTERIGRLSIAESAEWPADGRGNGRTGRP